MVRLSTYSSCLMRSRTILLKHLQQKNRLSYETGATNFSNNFFVLCLLGLGLNFCSKRRLSSFSQMSPYLVSTSHERSPQSS
jgi:hypothetical protein